MPFRFEASTFVNNTNAETDNGDYDAGTRAELSQLSRKRGVVHSACLK